MLDVAEFNKKISLSVGFLAAIVVGVATATSVYHKIVDVDDRGDRRYKRQQEDIKELQESIQTLQQLRITELEHENQRLQEELDHLSLKYTEALQKRK